MLDLIMQGNTGLMKAAERFDPQKGGSFGIYAAWWIKQSIKRALVNQSWGRFDQNKGVFNDITVGRRAADGNWDTAEVPPVNRIAKFLDKAKLSSQKFTRDQLADRKISEKKLSQRQLGLLADPATDYSKNLRHGEIGQGLNNYDAIFTELKRVGFDGWISIEDGVDGMDQLARSVDFLKRKIAQYW